MLQTISELWNGNVAPCEHCGSHDVQANRLSSLLAQHRNVLMDRLTDEQTELLQKYVDCSEDYLLRLLELAFCEGFSLGSKLIIEVLT